MKTQKFKHSGALGDLIYSLPIVRHFGGGEFYLHLNQMDWIGQHYYGAAPNPFHQGRMTAQDWNYMQSFMLAQPYIKTFDVMTPSTEITHNLDKFRPAFVGHPTNYIDLYAQTFNVAQTLSDQPWLSVAKIQLLPRGRTLVINRTQRWIPPTPGPLWDQLRHQGAETQAVFVGLEQEYIKFQSDTGWNLPWIQTPTMLELAQVIAGAAQFIGNQSSALAMAIGLGVPSVLCEARTDMPLARNECYFPQMANVSYF